VAEREAFLKALAANEDDVTARLVYADWLDEHGEHEEADRQRKWPAAKEWLKAFARQFNPDADSENEFPGMYKAMVDIRYFPVSYRVLVEMGQAALSEGYIDCGANEELCEALRQDDKEFWKNWSILTGVPSPSAVAGGFPYGCSC
jgi:uncharacterized protein (TIGR02996 family)